MVPLQILVQSSMASFPSQTLVLLEEQLMLVIPASHIQFCIAWCSLERGGLLFSMVDERRICKYLFNICP